MLDFIKLCERIIDTNGNPSVKDILECGYTMDHFIKIAQHNIKSEKLVKNAKQALIDRGIHYKEEK